MSFESAFDKVIGVEGTYSNNPADSGGETMWGITVAVARAAGYEGDMRRMPKEVARGIYRERYWRPMGCEDIAGFAPAIAEEIFEQAVNMGLNRAGTHLQRALNVLNRAGSDYPDVVVDGDVGGKTVRALYQFVWRRKDEGVKVFLKALNVLQGAFYLDLATRREKDEAFVYGWLRARVGL